MENLIMLNKPYIKYPTLYGVLAGISCFLFILLLQKGLAINPLGGKKEVGIIFLILAMILAVQKVRSANRGAINFKNAYGICFFTTLVTIIISVITLYVFLQFISVDTLPNYIKNTTDELVLNKSQIIKNGITEEAYNEALKNIKITNIKSILMDDMIKKIFLSIIPSLMVSLYFRRKFID